MTRPPTGGLMAIHIGRAAKALFILPLNIRQGLNETGFVEDQNVALDYRWAEGQYDRLAELAADLARQQVAVIVTLGGDASALAAKAGTRPYQSYSRLAATRSGPASSPTCIVLAATSQV